MFRGLALVSGRLSFWGTSTPGCGDPRPGSVGAHTEYPHRYDAWRTCSSRARVAAERGEEQCETCRIGPDRVRWLAGWTGWLDGLVHSSAAHLSHFAQPRGWPAQREEKKGKTPTPESTLLGQVHASSGPPHICTHAHTYTHSSARSRVHYTAYSTPTICTSMAAVCDVDAPATQDVALALLPSWPIRSQCANRPVESIRHLLQHVGRKSSSFPSNFGTELNRMERAFVLTSFPWRDGWTTTVQFPPFLRNFHADGRCGASGVSVPRLLGGSHCSVAVPAGWHCHLPLAGTTSQTAVICSSALAGDGATY